eukprot:TRINITY_DN31150_c0_g1_i1.p1 TRINITY_DN31150_c0_g1~~TRINITY_DN31150_c0_g1_i1.p1  ORF type:complete len:507 (+),score=114.27 TRINITY_DN31150_c0_g1_i1:111-1631(+)
MLRFTMPLAGAVLLTLVHVAVSEQLPARRRMLPTASLLQTFAAEAELRAAPAPEVLRATLATAGGASNLASVHQQLEATSSELANRPKLAAGCADASKSLVAGAATLLLGAFWFVALRLLLQQPVVEGADVGSRLAVLDAAKFLLMIPVINEHTTFWFGPSVVQGVMQYVHFHTRTFCFVSGLTAQSAVSEKGVRGVVFRLIVPTILWQLVGYMYFDRAIVQRKTPQDQVLHLFNCILTAPGISWYMYALVTWRVMGWALMSFRPMSRVMVSVALMIISGYSVDSPGFLRNAGVYLPLFVAGQLFPLKEVMARIPTVTPMMFATGAATLLLTLCWELSAPGLAFLGDIPYYSWGSVEGPPDGYCDFGAFLSFWMRGAFRNALELSKGLTLILLCCPRQETTLSRLGQYSLYTYLLHPWLQDVLNEFLHMRDWRPHPTADSGFAFQLLCMAGAVLYATAFNLILTSRQSRFLFSPILEPAWLERLCAAESKKDDRSGAVPMPPQKAA